MSFGSVVPSNPHFPTRASSSSNDSALSSPPATPPSTRCLSLGHRSIYPLSVVAPSQMPPVNISNSRFSPSSWIDNQLKKLSTKLDGLRFNCLTYTNNQGEKLSKFSLKGHAQRSLEILASDNYKMAPEVERKITRLKLKMAIIPITICDALMTLIKSTFTVPIKLLRAMELTVVELYVDVRELANHKNQSCLQKTALITFTILKSLLKFPLRLTRSLLSPLSFTATLLKGAILSIGGIENIRGVNGHLKQTTKTQTALTILEVAKNILEKDGKELKRNQALAKL